MAFEESKNEGKQPYKYNGKEFDNSHGLNLYDYSARYMEPALGRFTSVDPLAEKYYSISPYAYVMNNPLKYIDPNGDSVRVYIETVDYGHAWMSVGEGKDMAVYTYALNSKDKVYGDGVFSKLSGKAAQKYLDGKSNANYSTYTISDVTDEIVAKIADDFLGSSDNIISKESGYSFMTKDADVKVPDGGQMLRIGPGNNSLKSGEMSQGGRYSYDERYVGTYNPISNNCGTVVSDLLYTAGSKTFTEKNFLGGTQAVKYIKPSDLKKYLDKR